MSSIIKNKCTDGWGGGTGGSALKPTTVYLLDNAKCIRASHTCRGSFLCTQRNPKIWEDYERFEYDFEPFQELFHQDLDDNAEEHKSPLGHAVAFYNSIIYEKCRHNGSCNGHALLRRFQTTSTKGKNYFVGCSAWLPEHRKASSHLFRQIPSGVREQLVVELFMHGGPASLHKKMYTQYCYFCVPSRIGFRQKDCPRDHCDVDGKVIHGEIMQRKCSAEIIIFSPVERDIRKVLVITKPGVPHNHPSYAPEILSFEAAEAWREAIRVAGPLGL
ncbi:hypothetical protein M422DRAFT_47982 [Sphaerobolus stellatus SS14]|uniref:Uncharacterized protein n=1 Tax=Sphaerobolus stellatus (strain SS14) TaxID=990650 RepID=A0A0C9VXG8_SPHS4|nr:hypothetical protein M422DRAFT_47982 [Sphaerobolus stellatus SS14]